MSRARLEHSHRAPLVFVLPGELGLSAHPEPMPPGNAVAAAAGLCPSPLQAGGTVAWPGASSRWTRTGPTRTMGPMLPTLTPSDARTLVDKQAEPLECTGSPHPCHSSGVKLW